jgi:hypothetical protein
MRWGAYAGAVARSCIAVGGGGALAWGCTPHATLGSQRGEDAAADTDDSAARAEPGDAGVRPTNDVTPPPDLSVPSACDYSETRSLASRCQQDGGASLPEDLTADTLGTVRYYSGGTPLPAGRYRVAYVGGCMAYGVGASAVSGWTVHGSRGDFITGLSAFWMVRDDGSLIVIAPGTAGTLVVPDDCSPLAPGCEAQFATSLSDPSAGAFATYDECVTANCTLPATDFNFEGGVLGLRYGAISSVVTVPGESVGGRSPTYRLSRLDACP